MRTLSLLLLLVVAGGCAGTRRYQVNPDRELDIHRLADDVGDEYDYRTIGYVFGEPTIRGRGSERGFSSLYRRIEYGRWDFLTIGLTADRSYEVWHLVFKDPDYIRHSTIEVFMTPKLKRKTSRYETDYSVIRRTCMEARRPFATSVYDRDKGGR